VNVVVTVCVPTLSVVVTVSVETYVGDGHNVWIHLLIVVVHVFVVVVTRGGFFEQGAKTVSVQYSVIVLYGRLAHFDTGGRG
jgi:hypothetical protein